MRVVYKLEILESEIVNLRLLLIQLEIWERMRISSQLLAQRLHVV